MSNKLLLSNGRKTESEKQLLYLLIEIIVEVIKMDLKEIQNKTKDFCVKNDLETSLEFRVLDLVSEVGELSKEVLKVSNYGKDKIKLTENMKSEFGDVFFSLIASANCLGVDLEKSFNSVIEKYNKRLTKGGAGSEND